VKRGSAKAAKKAAKEPAKKKRRYDAFRESRTIGGCQAVYVLGCRTKDRYLTYVGWTTDVDRRLVQHNAGTGARTTRGRAWVLLHIERLRTRRQAMSREWYLKRDRKFRKQLAQKL
jgi:putative endonuclease